MLTALLPALVERDLAEFGAALSRVQRLVGDSFAPVQGGTFHPQAAPLVDALLRLGAAGAGQSSWGPAVYGVVGSEQQGHEVVRGLDARRRRASRGRALRQPRRARGGHMKLLVSVTDAAEARLAVAGGVDIVDVKNPAEGSLGAPAPGVIAQVRDVLPAELPLSAALGDLPCLPGTAALAALGAARSGAAYVKLGLWGVTQLEDAVAVLRAARVAVDGEAEVVAVAYADAARVPRRPLAPSELVAAAREAGLSGCLIDTAIKDGRGLLSWLARRRARRAGRRGARRRARDGAGRRVARGGPGGGPRRPAPTSPACARPPASRGGARRRSTRRGSRSCGRCARGRACFATNCALRGDGRVAALRSVGA